VERIQEEFPWVENVRVILDGQRHNQIAEVIVQGKRHVRLGATAVADELFKAVDFAVEKIEKQLLKVSKKMQERRP
jgi:ribosomal subunit interface protein